MSAANIIAWSFSNILTMAISILTIAAIAFPRIFGDFYLIPRKVKTNFVLINISNVVFQAAVLANAIVKQNDLYTEPPPFWDQLLQYWKSTFLGTHIMCIVLGDYIILSQYAVFDNRLLNGERLMLLLRIMFVWYTLSFLSVNIESVMHIFTAKPSDPSHHLISGVLSYIGCAIFVAFDCIQNYWLIKKLQNFVEERKNSQLLVPLLTNRFQLIEMCLRTNFVFDFLAFLFMILSVLRGLFFPDSVEARTFFSYFFYDLADGVIGFHSNLQFYVYCSMNLVAKDTIRNQRLGMSVFEGKTGEKAPNKEPVKLLIEARVKSIRDTDFPTVIIQNGEITK